MHAYISTHRGICACMHIHRHTCMRACIHIGAYMHIHTGTYACMLTQAHMHACIHNTHTQTNRHMSINAYTNTQAHVHACIQADTCACMRTHTQTHGHMCMHAHAHTLTHVSFFFPMLLCNPLVHFCNFMSWLPKMNELAFLSESRLVWLPWRPQGLEYPRASHSISCL